MFFTFRILSSLQELSFSDVNLAFLLLEVIPDHISLDELILDGLFTCSEIYMPPAFAFSTDAESTSGTKFHLSLSATQVVNNITQ